MALGAGVTSDPYAPLHGVPVIVAGRGDRPVEPRGGRVVPVEALMPIWLPTESGESRSGG